MHIVTLLSSACAWCAMFPQYIDKCHSNEVKVQAGCPSWLMIESEAERSGTAAGKEGYVDRIYLDPDPELRVEEGEEPVYTITQSQWPNTTLYNPWLGDKQGDKGPDFDDDGYRKMLCIEPTVSDANLVCLRPKESWTGSQRIVAN